MIKKISAFLVLAFASLALAGCLEGDSQDARDTEAVQRQQSQYAIGQPIPAFDWSLERDLLIQLYQVRNAEVTTHSVWRSLTGTVEGDCPSMGYGLPYDTSLTNPLAPTNLNQRGVGQGNGALTTIGQPEPNGVFASTNTAATWVFCLGATGTLEPVYVETTVTVYPGPVDVDYATNRVVRRGDPTVTIQSNSGD